MLSILFWIALGFLIGCRVTVTAAMDKNSLWTLMKYLLAAENAVEMKEKTLIERFWPFGKKSTPKEQEPEAPTAKAVNEQDKLPFWDRVKIAIKLKKENKEDSTQNPT